jgi:D-aminoacyl-tRNA deacylase
MFLLVASKEDTASMNIKRALLAAHVWEEKRTFEDNAVFTCHEGSKATLVTINKHHLYADDLDKKAVKALNIPPPSTVIFLSRHKSESGLRTLTVHPIGCYSKADYGGKDGTLVPSAPVAMTLAMRLVHERAKAHGLDFKVSYETTHHGPYLETPTFYIEIGSEEKAWAEVPPAEVLASAVLDVVRAGPVEEEPVAIGVGGGHYAPRFTDVALAKKMAFGHMVPSYALEKASEDALAQVVKKTPGAKFVYLHRKAMKAEEYKRYKGFFEGLGLEAVHEKDLEARNAPIPQA